jgi:hypothetical protein
MAMLLKTSTEVSVSQNIRKSYSPKARKLKSRWMNALSRAFKL